ncbi:MAG TPA: 30S ribosomal protein S20 [Pyrinomonadaceae bacterium]|nr:30S ribosomal protein S20 [Pyrinomonadaceae bacterium]
MPNHKSAEKRDRQNEKKRLVNRSNRSKLRTQIKKLRSALSGNNKNVSTELLNPTVSLIDKMVNKGILHRNTAARHKARLTIHVNNLSS